MNLEPKVLIDKISNYKMGLSKKWKLERIITKEGILEVILERKSFDFLVR